MRGPNPRRLTKQKHMDNKDALTKVAGNKKTKLWVLLGILAVLIIIILVAAWSGNKPGSFGNNAGNPAGNNGQTAANQNNATSSAPSATVTSNTQGLQPVDTKGLQPSEVQSLKDAKVVVPGANPIAPNNKVLTPTGQVTQTNVRSIDPTAPKQTGILDKASLPKTLLQVSVVNGQFTPSTISASAGAPISFSLTSADGYVHVLSFDDPSLNAISILVGPGQTKAITFNAPTKTGSYTFKDNAGSGNTPATGTLIVK